MSRGRFITGWIGLEVSGAEPERFLAALARQGVPFWRAAPPEDYALTVRLPAKAEKQALALAESLGGVPQGPAEYKFLNEEDKYAFLEASGKMLDEEDDTLTLPTVDLSEQAGQLKISADAIAALEGIVIFERGDKEAKA